jgi:TRADD-N domain-containing protein
VRHLKVEPDEEIIRGLPGPEELSKPTSLHKKISIANLPPAFVDPDDSQFLVSTNQQRKKEARISFWVAISLASTAAIVLFVLIFIILKNPANRVAWLAGVVDVLLQALSVWIFTIYRESNARVDEAIHEINCRRDEERAISAAMMIPNQAKQAEAIQRVISRISERRARTVEKNTEKSTRSPRKR